MEICDKFANIGFPEDGDNLVNNYILSESLGAHQYSYKFVQTISRNWILHTPAMSSECKNNSCSL